MLVMQRPTVEAIGEETNNRQRFAVGPLEPGFGHTLGNSLRRTLLSSIPGAAITDVRFDDALHEFDTINGVAEDVTDIILNFKDIVLTSDSPTRPSTLRLDVRGPAAVTAGDIECPADVEILNKDLHIATLNGKARLAIDLTVEQGRGLLLEPARGRVAHDRRDPDRRHLLPVRRVSLRRRADPRRAVDQLRQAGDRDRDRRFDHAERRARVGRRHVALAGRPRRQPERRAARVSSSARSIDAAASSPDLDLPIEDLDLSERPRNCLKRAQINTVGELLTKTEDDLLEHHQLRAEEPRRGQGEARRARPVAARLTRAATSTPTRTRRTSLPTPRRARSFGGSSAHERLMMANLAASLFAAEAITTTEAKAKALRPLAEKLITKAKKAQDGPMRVHRIRQIQGYLGDREMTHKLVNDVAPRYLERNGGYTRILKLGTREGDNAKMARIELV